MGLPEKMTSDVFGVIRIARRDTKTPVTLMEKVMARNLQSVIATVMLVFKERVRYQQSDVIIRNFVNQSRLFFLLLLAFSSRLKISANC